MVNCETETTAPIPGETIADLGDGLRLRHARPEDADAVATLNGDVHRSTGDTGPDERIAAWTRDLLTRPHPTVTPAHALLVEDTTTGAIASTLVLIPQTWSYGGIPFGVGRIELVSTAVPYRRRGLVRQQMEAVHRWSTASGDLAQAITGIPWYYRQFGYEMTLALGGSRQVVLPASGAQSTSSAVPPAGSPGTPETEPTGRDAFKVRAATLADLPALVAIDGHATRRGLVACVRDEATWRYQLTRSSPDAIGDWDIRVVTAPDGSVAAYLVAERSPWDDRLPIVRLEAGPTAAWVDIVTPVLDWATERASEMSRDGTSPVTVVSFTLGPDHPVYPLLTGRIMAARRPYAWYLRVPDVTAFIRRVRPVLEAHLVASPAAGFTGTVTISSYRTGFSLQFREGAIKSVDSWQEPDDTASARFPDGTFLQLLSGWRDLGELEHAFPDCIVRDEHRAVISGLFPRRNSWIWPLD